MNRQSWQKKSEAPCRHTDLLKESISRIDKKHEREGDWVSPYFSCFLYAFYLDSEGHANFEQKVLDEVVNSIQEKVPSYVTVQGDGQFLADLDLFRETKYDELMAQMQATNPQFAVMGDYAESGKKVKLTKPILDEFLKDSEYDGIVLARVDVAQVKQNWNLWIGGIDTKAELDVTLRVFNKHSQKGYVFNNRQRVIGKSHAMMNGSTDRAARKAIPKALEKVKSITVE